MDRGVSDRPDASTIAPFRRLSVAIALTIQSITRKRENNGLAKIDREAARRRANGGWVLGYPSAQQYYNYNCNSCRMLGEKNIYKI